MLAHATQGLAIVVATILLVSVLSKLSDWEATLMWIEELLGGRGALSATHVASLIVLAESGLAVGIVWIPAFGGIAVAAWIAGATGLLFGVRNRVADCACFGRRKRTGWKTVLRNSLIAAGAIVVAFAALQALFRPSDSHLWLGVSGSIAAVWVMLRTLPSRPEGERAW